MRAATVVQALHGLFYVLLQHMLVVAAIIVIYCKFYCKFYCSCDPSLCGVWTQAMCMMLLS